MTTPRLLAHLEAEPRRRSNAERVYLRRQALSRDARYLVLTAILRRYFRRLAAEAAKRVERDLYAASAEAAALKEADFIPADSARGLWMAISPAAGEAARQGAAAADEFFEQAAGLLPDPEERRAFGRIAARQGERITGIDETTRRMVRGALARSAEQGASLHDTTLAVRNVISSPWRSAMIARTELGFANAAANSMVWEEHGVEFVEISDGINCGWSSHNDPEHANGLVVTREEYEQTPLAHPNCVRLALPMLSGMLSSRVARRGARAVRLRR